MRRIEMDGSNEYNNKHAEISFYSLEIWLIQNLDSNLIIVAIGLIKCYWGFNGRKWTSSIIFLVHLTTLRMNEIASAM
jgi:hypothetical protein